MKKLISKCEKLLDLNTKKADEEVKKIIGQLYEKYGEDLPNEIKKYGRQDKLKKELLEVSHTLFKENQMVMNVTLRQVALKTTERVTKDLFNLYYKDIDDLPKIKGIKDSKDITRIVNSDMSGLKWTERHKYNRDYTVKKIQESVTRGVNNGERYEQLAKGLSKQLKISENQAIRILRTEGHRVHSQTKQENYEEIVKVGIPLKKMWLSSQDERVRSTHEQLDGQVVDIDKPFKINGYEAMYPGGFGVAELDINCRCEAVMLIE